ncbi:MAG: prolipoprotein diacylglyceryl transferase [Bowdeniella nasicola]|nr:prolipoprotein diacylglyceryl transferase [Bowdeniella nasicola]
MYPTWEELLGWPVRVDTHATFVALGLAVAGFVMWRESTRRALTSDHLLYTVAGALAGGALFMRLGTWLRHLDLRQNASLVEQWSYGNRSIIGGLLGAWIGVHVVKRLIGMRERTGDIYAPAVAAGMAIGRIGCLLTETPGTACPMCALGAPCLEGRGLCGLGLVLDTATAERLGAPAGVALHASFGYEIAFHLIAFAVLWGYLRYRPIPPGETFVLYVGGYAVFRFFVEFVRGNEVVAAGLTRPQLVLAVTIPLLLWRLWRQARRGDFDALKPHTNPALEVAR